MLVSEVTAQLAGVGLHLNIKKFKSLSICADGARKCVYVDSSQKILIDNVAMGTLTIGEYYKYLDIQIGAQDTTDAGIYQDLQDQLTRMTQATLSPQQRLHVLKVDLVPGLQH